MRDWPHTQTEEVAGDRPATSSQPPRVTLTLAARASSQGPPHPIWSTLLPDTPDALLEGLRSSPAPRPLPTPTHVHGEAISGFPLRSRAIK
jgi:hypothetical protein